MVDLDGDALEDIVSSVSDQSEKAATGQRKPRKKELIREKRTRCMYMTYNVFKMILYENYSPEGQTELKNH